METLTLPISKSSQPRRREGTKRLRYEPFLESDPNLGRIVQHIQIKDHHTNIGRYPTSPRSSWCFASSCLRVSSVALLALAGCGPNYSQVADRLRRQTIEQEAQIKDLNQKVATRDAAIADLQAKLDGSRPTLPTLPADRLANLITATRLEIRNNTDTNDPDGKGLSGFRVFVRTISDNGEILPATGTLNIEAFELPPAPAAPRRLGTWTFTPADMKKNWYSAFNSNYFALNCPWTSPPTIDSVIFKARFTDALTGRTLEAELSKKITLTTR